MPDAKYSIAFDIAARRFFERIATAQDQVAIGEIVTSLHLSPATDGRTRRPFPHEPERLMFFTDRVYWAIYEVPAPGELVIVNLGYAYEEPTTDRDWPPL
jgi:hypothetical protein